MWDTHIKHIMLIFRLVQSEVKLVWLREEDHIKELWECTLVSSKAVKAGTFDRFKYFSKINVQ